MRSVRSHAKCRARIVIAFLLMMGLATNGAYFWLHFSTGQVRLKQLVTQPEASHDLSISRSASAESDQSAKSLASEAYLQLPLSFEANHGQADPAIKFISRGQGYRLFLTATEAALTLEKGRVKDERQKGDGLSPFALALSPPATLRITPVGANPVPQVEGLDALPGKSHYFTGNDPQQWCTDIPAYARVKYREVYPGVDLIYYGHQHQLEYDFILAPGADPGLIKLAFEGAEGMSIDANGELVLRVAGGKVRQPQPVVYQEVNGLRQNVDGHYVRTGRNEVGFELGAYDPNLKLVIDPVLSYSSYLGGSGFEHGNAIALDAAGNIYLAGGSGSSTLPVTNTAQPAFGGTFDAFVMKLNPAGNTVIYATYFGGSGGDSCFGLALDATGNIYLTGLTASTNFPTLNPIQSSYGGGSFDAYAAKLNASGALVYSTYLGGSGTDQSNGMVIDADGNAYITGITASANFPTASALQATYGGGSSDAFVCKINPSGSALVFSTFLGGSLGDVAGGIATDANRNVFVSGGTQSTNFPIASQLQASLRGTSDAFVSKFNAAGSALLYSTYLGGSGVDTQGFPGNPLLVDSEGNAYLTGRTSSSDFPTVNALQPAFGGGANDAFVAKLNASGSALVYSTYLGGTGSEGLSSDGNQVQDIALDAAGNIYLTGTTSSTNFPTASAVQSASGGGFDSFVTKLNASGSAIVYSTYLGGGGNDDGLCLAVDAIGNAYLSGRTLSNNFPLTNAMQSTHGGGGYDAFIVRLGADAVTVSAASYSGAAITSKAIVSAFGTSLATSIAAAASIPLPTTLAGTTVKIRDSAGTERSAPLFFVSAGQINYQIPEGTATGPASVIVTSSDGRISSAVVPIAQAAPSIFTFNQGGSGPAVAVDALTGTLAPFAATRAGGEPNILSVFGTGLGADATDTGGNVSASVQATIDGSAVSILYAGPAPGFVGLNQWNVVLPAGISSGTHTLVMRRNGVASNTVTIAIR